MVRKVTAVGIFAVLAAAPLAFGATGALASTTGSTAPLIDSPQDNHWVTVYSGFSVASHTFVGECPAEHPFLKALNADGSPNVLAHRIVPWGTEVNTGSVWTTVTAEGKYPIYKSDLDDVAYKGISGRVNPPQGIGNMGDTVSVVIDCTSNPTTAFTNRTVR